MGRMPGRRAVAAVIVTTLAAGWLAGATPSLAAAAPRSAAAVQPEPPGSVPQPACAAAHGPDETACATTVSATRSAAISNSRISAAKTAGSSSTASGTAPPGYSPLQLQSAYQLPSASAGNLQTVAVIAPYDDPNVASDLATYRSQFGELPCPQTQSLSTLACFTEINEAGALITTGSGTAPAASPSWALTTSAQLDAVSAVCPNCRLLLVEVNSAAITDLGAGVEQAISNGADVVTIGADQPETTEDPTWDGAYFQHPGVAITAAAGLGGFQTTSQNYPAASQYVTAVGGTTLTPAGTGTCTTTTAGLRGWCESVWNDSYGATASGCSVYDSEPPWQKSGIPAADTGCGSLRTVADVAADADPATGIAVFDSGEGDWQGGTGVGGTAVAAAIVAGVYALAGTPQAADYPAEYPYEHPSGLNDITTGSNTTATNPTCSPAYLCTAGTGYDGPTGLGSPAGTAAFTAGGWLTGPLYNGINNMCADDANDATSNGNKIQIWECLGDASQNWTVEANGTIRVNGDCLDVTGGVNANGTKIQLYQCLAGDQNQQWMIQPQDNGSLTPGVELVNHATGRCLDNYDTSSTGNGTDNGTQLDIWACNGNPNQQWTLPYPQPGVSDRLISNYPAGAGAAAPMCADDYNGSSTNGNKIDTWECNNNAGSQDWMIAANGTLKINGSCADVRDLGTADKTLVQLWSCTGATNQQWRFLPDGAIMGLESGKCLDETSTTTDGTQLFIYDCNQDAAQTWTPVPYSADY